MKPVVQSPWMTWQFVQSVARLSPGACCDWQGSSLPLSCQSGGKMDGLLADSSPSLC